MRSRLLIDRTRFGQAASATLFAVVALLAMEAASRLDDHWNHGAPLWGSYDFERLFTFDGRVVRGVPHAQYAKWSLNSVGMRGPEPAAAPGIPRAVVYGASESFGIYESDGKEFPRVMQERLRADTGLGQFEVLNAGVPGMRVGSGTEYIEWLGQRFQPRVVVIYPTPTHYIGVSRPLCGRPARAASSASDVKPSSRLLAKLTDRIKESLPRSLLTMARKGAIAWATRGTQPLDRVPPSSLEAFKADLDCAVQAVRRIGATPVLVTHANRFAAPPAADEAMWLTGWRMQYPELREAGFIDLEQRANALVREVAQQADVELVDAASELTGRAELFADHAHFNDAGAQRMGNLLARRVAALLKP